MIKFQNITSFFDPAWVELRQHLRALEKLPKAGGAQFNGWSLQGRNGLYTDGWVDGSVFLQRDHLGAVKFNASAARAAGYFPSEEHVQRTSACSDQFWLLIEQLQLLKLSPCRARLIQLVPGAVSSWHTDGKPETPVFRVHFVLETNDNCWFYHGEHASLRQHLQVEHVYLINVNDWHKVANEGATNRTHLVVDVRLTADTVLHLMER